MPRIYGKLIATKKTEAKNASVFSVNLVLLYKSQFAHGNSVFGSCVKQNNSVATATSKKLLVPLSACTVVHFAPCSWAVCKRLQVTLYAT